MSRERDKNPAHVLQMLRTLIGVLRAGGVTVVHLVDLEQAVDNVEAKQVRK